MAEFFKRIFDVFSRRPENSSVSVAIPETFRNRVFLWCQEVFSNGRHPVYAGAKYDYSVEFWNEIHRKLQFRHGRVCLSNNFAVANQSGSISLPEDCINFLRSCSGNEFLDFIEYIFHTDLFHIEVSKGQLVTELNEFLRVDNLPFYITDFVEETFRTTFHGQERDAIRIAEYPRVITRDNEFSHSAVVKPTLDLLQQSHFKTANTEFLNALEDYRKGDYGDCLTKCASAFESVLKITCDRKAWPYKSNDTASTLVRTLLSKTTLENYFEPMLMIVSTLRNKLSPSHGAGTIPRTVQQHLARYAINATASAILLIVDESGS